MDRGTPEPFSAQRRAVPARIALAVAVVDSAGLVTHWSAGAHGLFGHPRERAVGRPAADLMPISGALLAAPGYPSCGRARSAGSVRGQVDVLWWAYPLVGPGPERLLVLASDAAGLSGGTHDRVAPGFAPHTVLTGAGGEGGRKGEVRGLAELPGMAPAVSARIVAQVLELGHPVLEISRRERIPVTPDWATPPPPPETLPRQGGPRENAGPRPAAPQPAAAPAAARTPAPVSGARGVLLLDDARPHTRQEAADEPCQDGTRTAGCDTVTRRPPGTRPGRGGWSDTVRLPGSRTALVVGGVLGRAPDTEATAGRLRTAVQTMAALDLPPGRLLSRLDDLARRLGARSPATCLYAVYDPIRSELTLANAGHLPPVLLRADGGGAPLELPTGVPIGIGGVAFEPVTVRVAPGDRLVLCTDGLLEVRGRSGAEGSTGLAALCAAVPPAASLDDACDALARALGAGREDGPGLLMARLSGIPPEHVAEWRLDPAPREVGRARRLVAERLRAWGLAEAVETATVLVSEIVTNAVRHTASRHLGLRLVRTDTLLCEVTDEDHTLPALLGSDLGDEFGRGLRVVGGLAREWGASHDPRGKTVWCEQSLPRAADAGG
ncbi:SpoIIE family protein phosphatase [Streptomyces albireticuli]|uniref:PAS domain-containing protein n=1 Tax=Streptomyces albireticuli TaxID=1940 RepID=A0A2A2D9L1_9ACTN|nr:SpoIIE family protein phosphatase [Streptomyces albireticuli]MCD9140796.1 SpoIIE family protein phosphatase [Streptomyces albireticuli]MCD9161242.1 SpoIIE family protein phosphatase [Streptomyces albireticuli]MCD9190700.1 SpoIIE family protein phosphatase [Streptomyces albireticuli]PAU49173.1 hypothetical protein CK936_09190 [Streptomyces albireticuli]